MSWPDWLWVDVSDDVDRCGTAFELPIVLHEIRTRSYSSGYHPVGHTQLSPPYIALRLPLHYIHYRPVPPSTLLHCSRQVSDAAVSPESGHTPASDDFRSRSVTVVSDNLRAVTL